MSMPILAPHQPWYQHGWLWLIFGLPSAAVVASLVTVYIAAQDDLALVAEDYYQRGKAINQDLSREARARALGLRFRLEQRGQELTLVPLPAAKADLRPARAPAAPPSALRLSLFHPTLNARDSVHLLTADAQGQFRLTLPTPLRGHWQVRLEPLADVSDPTALPWRVQGRWPRVEADTAHTALLLGALPDA
ncbi:MAG: FixH family protein [Aeromonas sp.]